MANGIFSSLGRLGNGSRFSVLPILAPAFIRSQGIVSTSSICVNSAVVFFCMRHYLKTYLLPRERATTMGQRLPRPPRPPAGHRGSFPASPAVPGGCPAAPPPAGACPRRAWRGSEGARDARRGHSALGDLRLSSEPAPAHWPRPAPQPGPRPPGSTGSVASTRRVAGLARDTGSVATTLPPDPGASAPPARAAAMGGSGRRLLFACSKLPSPVLAPGGSPGGTTGVYLLEALQITLSVWEEIRVNRFCSCSLTSFFLGGG